MSKILEAALYYARHDLDVIPLKPGLKRPATKNGLLEGTTDPDQIKRS